MSWTEFWDMHSGGSLKEKWHYIYIEAPEKEAKVIFYNRFGHSPDRVTCTCCGEDYSIEKYDTLEHASGYHRGCAYDESGSNILEKPSWDRPYIRFEDWLEDTKGDHLVIRAEDIKPDQCKGEVPEQGYVWKD